MTRRPGARLRDWLARGSALTERDFAWRHSIVCAVVALHLPVLVLMAWLRGAGLRHGLLEAAPVAVLLAVALGPVRRRSAALASTFGLLLCSAVLVHLFNGSIELHFHYFVAVALVALYEEWAVFAAAIAFVALQHGIAGALAPGTVFPDDGHPWITAAVHAGFVLAESAVLVLFWHAAEQSRQGEQRLQEALWEGQRSLQARLEETERIRADLIAMVSHEFRTPLTGIRGTALTLLKRGDRLDPARRAQLLQAVLEHQERLSRLLENMLTASSATAPDRGAVTDVAAVAVEVAMVAGAARPGRPQVAVLVAPGTLARIDRAALHQVLANLVDNAIVHGTAGSVPLITGGHDSRGAWVAVSNDGSSMEPSSADRMFEPFTRADTGATRGTEGVGMGLYVVRRLVEVYGGEVEVRSDAGWVTVEVRLPALETLVAVPPVPVSV